jgi:hypothetical protein
LEVADIDDLSLDLNEAGTARRLVDRKQIDPAWRSADDHLNLMMDRPPSILETISTKANASGVTRVSLVSTIRQPRNLDGEGDPRPECIDNSTQRRRVHRVAASLDPPDRGLRGSGATCELSLTPAQGNARFLDGQRGYRQRCRSAGPGRSRGCTAVEYQSALTSKLPAREDLTPR